MTGVQTCALPICHSDRAVQPDHLTVQHRILRDMQRHFRELRRITQPRGKRHLCPQRGLHILGQSFQHRRQEQTDDSIVMFDKALEYAAQLPPSLARKIYKAKCRTQGGAHEACGQEASDFVATLD